MRSRLRTSITITALSIVGMLLIMITTVKMIEPMAAGARGTTGTGTWSVRHNMHYARIGDTATMLANGKVLDVGGASGSGAASTELYDPKTGQWTLTGHTHTPRLYHVAVLLTNGDVLVAGGFNTSAGNGALTSAELYHPGTGTWQLTGSMHIARENFSATLLPNGNVLVAGGDNGHQPFVHALASAEIYNPKTGRWKLTSSMHTARFNQHMMLLSNGKVLVTGGDDGAGYQSSNGNPLCLCKHATASTELYNPVTGTWSSTGAMHDARDLFMAVAIPNASGDILATGGISCDTSTGTCLILSSTEVYSPVKGTWTLTGSMTTPRYAFTAARMKAGSGKVLVTGGLTPQHDDTAATEMYDASSGTWLAAQPMTVARDGHISSCLQNGQILVIGGMNSAGMLSSTELFTL